MNGGDAGFTIIEHTADLGIRVTAPSLPELFVQAARGVYAVLGRLEVGVEPAAKTIAVAAPDPEGLLHDWLAELLWAFDSAGHLYDRFEFARFEPTCLEAHCRGRAYDRARSERDVEIKAVTYHDLNIRRNGELYEVTIIFDI